MSRFTKFRRSGPPSTVSIGVTDLMTSLAVIFILLLAATITKTPDAESQTKPQPRVSREDIRTVFQDHSERFGLYLESDPRDPLVLRIIVPAELLNFEFGKSTLSPMAKQFLAEATPSFAQAWCGPLRNRIDAVVIEGHTDDRGEDRVNLRLSQERSLNVMVEALEVIQKTQPWAYDCFQEITSASGRGKQDLIYEGNHNPNRDKSRRVILKIRLRAEREQHVLGTQERLSMQSFSR
jgi:outer membrane protein OmpA-like peptidoglycan-associated protein